MALRHLLAMLRRMVPGRDQSTNGYGWFLVQVYGGFPRPLTLSRSFSQKLMCVASPRLPPVLALEIPFPPAGRGPELRVLVRRMSVDNPL